MASPPGGGGGGKIRTRRYHINAKPYSKSQPQGILGRVTDSVKSIVPVWLQKYFHKGEDSCPAVSESRLLTERQSANQEIENHVYDVDEPRPLREGRVTPEPTIRHVDEPSTSRTSLQFPDVLTRPSLHRSNLNFSMLDSPTLHCQPSTSSVFPIGSSGFSLVKEIRDSASQHDDDNISTTSGFSSRASDKDVSISKSMTGPPLWSPEPERSHSFTQQNSSLRKPSFNLSAFGSLSPSLANTSQLKSSQLGDSPFYPGKTTYGGAASIRQTKVRTTPYQAPLRRQMKAKQSNMQSYGVTSSTARRILQSLDKMSSPLADARRIPSTASSPLSVTPDRSFLGGAEFQLKKRVHSNPPVQKLLTPKSVSVSINRSMYIKPSLPASQASKISLRTEENSVARKRNHTDEQLLEDSTLRFSYPKSSTPAANGLSAGGGGGKMRRECGAHYTKCVQEEEGVDVPALPNISLPISSSALPSFSFPSVARTTALSSTTVTKPVTNMVQPTNSLNSSPVFTFSSPIVKSRETSTPPLGSPIGFTFSIPGVKSADLSTITKKPTSTVSPAKTAVFSSPSSNSDEQYDGPFKPAKTLKTGSVLDVLKSPAFASTRTSAIPSVSPVVKTSTIAKSEMSTFNVGGASFGTMYKSDATLWQCDTCLVQNKATDSKCVACSTSKVSTLDSAKQIVASTSSSITRSTPTVTSGFGDKFKPATGSWECDTCLVQNKPEATKCVACETPKPGTGVKPALTLPSHTSTATISASPSSFTPTTALLGFGDKFKRPPGSWDCIVCLVQNKAEDSNCISCLSQKPGESALVTSSTAFSVPASFGASEGFGDKFKKPEGSWDCETCFVQNKADSIKCAACESAKPGTKAELKGFGTSVAPSNTAVPSFKFGIQSSVEPSSTSGIGGGFKFVDQGGFKFGITSSDSGASSTTTGGFSFPKIGERSFGIPSTNSKSDEPKKDSALGNSGFTFGLASGSSNSPSAASELSKAGQGQQEKKELKSIPGGFMFSVGSAATVSSSESSGIFNLQKAEDKADSGVSPFTFGRPVEKKNEAPTTLGGFTFGKVEQPKEPVTIAPFVVGRTVEKADSVSASSLPLMFGKQPETEPPKPSLSFGKTDQTKDDPARPTFSFGVTKPAETKDPEPSAKQCLTFGGSTSASDQGAAKPSFSFQSVGSSSTVASSTTVATSTGFGSSTSASNAPTATFLFGQASSTSGGSTFGSTNDAKVPPSFIFSSQEGKPTTTSSSAGTTASTAPFVFGPAGSSTNTAAPNFSFGTTNTSSSTGTTTTPFMFVSGSSAAVAPSFGTTLANPPAFGSLASAPGFSTGPQPPIAFGSGASSNPTPLFGQQASQPPAFGSSTAASNAGPSFQFGASSSYNFSTSNSSGIFTFGTNTGGPTAQPQTQPRPQPPTQSGFGFNPPAASFTLGTNGKNVTNRRIKTAVRRRK